MLTLSVINMTYSSELKGTFAFLSIINDVIAAPGFDGDKDTFMLQFEVVREGKRNYCRFVSFDPRTFLQLPKTGIL